MLYQELVTNARKLSFQQKLQLIEDLTHALREDATRAEKRPSSLARVRGMLKGEGPPPTDQEVADDYADYLTEKYT